MLKHSLFHILQHVTLREFINCCQYEDYGVITNSYA